MTSLILNFVISDFLKSLQNGGDTPYLKMKLLDCYYKCVIVNLVIDIKMQREIQ